MNGAHSEDDDDLRECEPWQALRGLLKGEIFDQGGARLSSRCEDTVKSEEDMERGRWELKMRWVPRVLRLTHTDTIMLSVSDHVM